MDQVSGVETKESIKELINKVDSLMGAKGVKETLKFYNKFATMVKKNEIEIGNLNIIFHCESREGTYKEVIEVINTILLKHKIVTNDYIELESRSDFNKIEERKLYVIDYEDDSISYDIDRIKRLVKKNSKSVFILAYADGNERRNRRRNMDDDDFELDEISRKMKSSFYWNVIVEEPSKNEKEEYIKNQINKNGYSYKDNSAFIVSLAKKELCDINQELIEAFIKVKMARKKVLEDKYFNIKVQEEVKVAEKEGLKKLEDLTGLEDVKKQIEKIINYVEVHKERKGIPMLHICMTGNPGTGKTTVARIIGEIFSDFGILSDKNKFVEVGRDNLVAGYVGQTALRTKDAIERAKGGVLFIDEAYALVKGKDERKNDFGHECIATLIKEMENHRDNLCVIFAGYKEEMKHLISSNSGFESRIQFFIDFPDYTEQEMLTIFENMLENDGFILEEKSREVLLDYFSNEINCKTEQFGNGRLVRNLFEKVKFEQAVRIKRENSKDIDNINIEDIINVVEEVKTVPIKTVIGFAC